MTGREMTRHEYQMQALGLRNYELYMYNDLMESPMNEWPESLSEYVNKQAKKYGLCGEVISQAVAQWIKKESAEPAECIECGERARIHLCTKCYEKDLDDEGENVLNRFKKEPVVDE
jgi:hypothetical protein